MRALFYTISRPANSADVFHSEGFGGGDGYLSHNESEYFYSLSI